MPYAVTGDSHEPQITIKTLLHMVIKPIAKLYIYLHTTSYYLLNCVKYIHFLSELHLSDKFHHILYQYRFEI